MAKEIVTHSWCDLCLDDDIREPGVELVAQVGAGTKQKLVDLCERHRKELADPLVALLAEHGRTAGPPSTALLTEKKTRSKDMPGPFLCQVPDCTSEKIYAAAGSLSWHVRSQHEPMTFGEYRQQYGLVRAELPPDELAAFNAKRAMRRRPGAKSEPAAQADEPLDLPVDKAVDKAVDMAVDRAADQVRDALQTDTGEALDSRFADLSPEEYTCRVDGCDVSYPPSKHARPTQALGVHLARKHGIRSERVKV